MMRLSGVLIIANIASAVSNHDDFFLVQLSFSFRLARFSFFGFWSVISETWERFLKFSFFQGFFSLG